MDIEDLEKVYEYAPSSTMVGTLLVREINKLEQNYLALSLNNNTDEFYSKQGNAEVTEIGPEERGGKWLLWAGILVLVAGGALVAFVFKKHPENRNLKIAGFVLTAVGAAGLIAFVVNQSGDSPGTVGRIKEDGFFVALPDSVKNTYDNHIGKLRTFCTKLTDGLIDIPSLFKIQ